MKTIQNSRTRLTKHASLDLKCCISMLKTWNIRNIFHRNRAAITATTDLFIILIIDRHQTSSQIYFATFQEHLQRKMPFRT